MVPQANTSPLSRSQSSTRTGSSTSSKRPEDLLIALKFLENLQQADDGFGNDVDDAEVRRVCSELKKMYAKQTGRDDAVSTVVASPSGSGWSNSGDEVGSEAMSREYSRTEPPSGFGPPARITRRAKNGDLSLRDILDVSGKSVASEYVVRWQQGWHPEGWNSTTQKWKCFDGYGPQAKLAQNSMPKRPRNIARQHAGHPQLHRGECCRDWGVEDREIKAYCPERHNDEEWDCKTTSPATFDFWGPRQNYTKSGQPGATNPEMMDRTPRGAKSVHYWQRGDSKYVDAMYVDIDTV